MYAHAWENTPICLHTLKLKFDRSVFIPHVSLPLSSFLFCFDGTLYVLRLFKVHVSGSRCRLNGVFKACCVTSISRFPETGFDQRVQTDIWKSDGYSEECTIGRVLKTVQYWVLKISISFTKYFLPGRFSSSASLKYFINRFKKKERTLLLSSLASGCSYLSVEISHFK